MFVPHESQPSLLCGITVPVHLTLHQVFNNLLPFVLTSELRNDEGNLGILETSVIHTVVTGFKQVGKVSSLPVEVGPPDELILYNGEGSWTHDHPTDPDTVHSKDEVRTMSLILPVVVDPLIFSRTVVEHTCSVQTVDCSGELPEGAFPDVLGVLDCSGSQWSYPVVDQRLCQLETLPEVSGDGGGVLVSEVCQGEHLLPSQTEIVPEDSVLMGKCVSRRVVLRLTEEIHQRFTHELLPDRVGHTHPLGEPRIPRGTDVPEVLQDDGVDELLREVPFERVFRKYSGSQLCQEPLELLDLVLESFLETAGRLWSIGFRNNSLQQTRNTPVFRKIEGTRDRGTYQVTVDLHGFLVEEVGKGKRDG